MNRKGFLSLLLWMTLVALTSAGCAKNAGSPTPNRRPVAVAIFIDHSGSIVGFPNGGLAGIEKNYKQVTQATVKPILQKYDGVHVTVYDFVNTYDILMDTKVDKWEEIVSQIDNFIDQPPHPQDQAMNTNFSTMIDQVGVFCTAHSDCDVYVLILTDGHNDDSREDIQAAANRFSPGAKANLKFVLMAPVEPDMVNRWRENMQSDLQPLGTVAVVNSSDYRDGVAQMFATMGGK